MRIGREAIYTNVDEITSENVIEVLQKAMIEFTSVASECDSLLKFESGFQPLQRQKTYRPEINCQAVDNVANEITEFKCAYEWQNPITLVQRGAVDSGSENESEIEAITLLNEMYAEQNIGMKQQELARFVEICGVGYTFVDINTDRDADEDESYFTVNVLDPRFAFIVRSNRYADKRPMLGVSFFKDSTTGDTYFTCFSKDMRFEILNQAKFIGRSKKKEEIWDRQIDDMINPLGMIPIIEWVRSADRMGSWERQRSEMDNLNILISDFTNDVDQNTQCVWVTTDIDFPEDDNGNILHPKANDWMQTYSSKDGKTPTIKALTVDYDYSGSLNNIITRRELILQKCNVPCRNDNSGGSTGVAMDSATGWASAENVACKGDEIRTACKMNEVKAVLRAIKKNPDLPSDSPLRKLRAKDVQPNIKRQKTYELSVKTTALATLLQCGVYGLHALNLVNAFDDNNQVWTDSKELMEKIQKKNASDNQTQTEVKPTSDDPINQITNSPNIDGMGKEDTPSEE